MTLFETAKRTHSWICSSTEGRSVHGHFSNTPYQTISTDSGFQPYRFHIRVSNRQQVGNSYKTLAEDGQLWKKAECRHETGEAKPKSACSNLRLVLSGSFGSRCMRATNVRASCLATSAPEAYHVHLTFIRNPASYIKDGHTATFNTPHFLYFFNKYTYWIF
jgi:hypothetical protein